MNKLVTLLISTEQKIEEMELSMNEKIFPTKLWRLVNNSDIDAIVWNHHGDGIIVKKDLIEKEFLSSNGFKASTFSSFVRRLNFYGFKKYQCLNTDNIHHYFHPNFKRNQPELLPLLRGCNQRSRPSVKDDVKNELTERWRGHRDLCDRGDDATNLSLFSPVVREVRKPHHLLVDVKEPGPFETQHPDTAVPPDVACSAGSSDDSNTPQSFLPHSGVVIILLSSIKLLLMSSFGSTANLTLWDELFLIVHYRRI